jgi:hypothetical protein
MWQRVVIGIGAASFLLSPVYSRTPGASEYDLYYNGKQYKFLITQEQQARCPKWNPRTTPNPPYAAAKALNQARQFIDTIATKNNSWTAPSSSRFSERTKEIWTERGLTRRCS